MKHFLLVAQEIENEEMKQIEKLIAQSKSFKSNSLECPDELEQVLCS
jgi:hypothetical protein